jgi:UTP-glucose-1-phosphate uridylyltransferase
MPVMKVVIPAGGEGRRFYPLTHVVPKELLLLGDKPLLHHALDEVAAAGFEGAVIVVAPWKRPLFEAYFEAARSPIPAEVVVQEVAAGIGDAVLRASRYAGERFGVLLPDDVVTGSEHWAQLTAAGGAALCYRQVPSSLTSRFGIVVVEEGRIVEIEEKPAHARSNLAIFGRYVVDDQVLQGLEHAKAGRELELTYGFAAAKDVRAVEFSGDIYDCGTPESYLESSSRWYSMTVAASAVTSPSEGEG